MSNYKTIITMTAATLFAAPAFAQDDAAPVFEDTADTMTTDFVSADLDQDGALNSDEFVTFSVMRAEAGEADYTDLVLGGDYDTKFTMHDADASGGLTVEELGGAEEGDHDSMSPDSEEEVSEPDLN